LISHVLVVQRDKLLVDESGSIVIWNVFADGQLRRFEDTFFQQLHLLGKKHLAVKGGV
jgi:hypothetical protein